MDVGVDVELIRADADLDGIAAKFFTRAEQDALASLPPAQRLAASFHCWTRKEAYLKGIGAGLTSPLLRTVDVWAGGHHV
jgi:4'-phosphopantetheinyl transferase